MFPRTSTPTTARFRKGLAVLASSLLMAGLWLTGMVPVTSAHADESDHEMARRALREGKVMPLRAVLDKVEKEFKGQVLEVELEHDDGRFIYEIKMLGDQGMLSKLKVDAATGQILKIKQKRKH